ncbi:PadR family transcriptional regulator [Nocardioides alcanivorans]|uniref:PadR family transcriptional regulator n=1 Tax=Nocardioides alcanivorans TaxID=2897352 RepID=UPI001F33DEF1|nr:PadR family transcriptional regulator [Nocardioides alcanivorans]
MNSHGDNTERNTPDESGRGRHGEGRGRGRRGPDGGDHSRDERGRSHGDRRRGGRREGGPDFAGFGHGGPPPWLAGLFDGPGAGRGRGRGRGAPKVRRGDVRSAILDVLRNADEAINGYQVIQQIAERTGDAWRPSPGSVYPTIQQLQDEGLVASDEASGRRTLDLTEAG